MNPFDGPPSSPPVSFDRPPGPPTEPVDPPAPTPGPEPRRGRMVAAVFATAGLLGAGAFGVSELVSADDDPGLTDVAEPDTGSDDATTDDATGAADEPDATTDERSDVTDDTDDTDGHEAPSFHADGKLRLDLGDGEPIIIDLDEIDPEALDQFTTCIGLPGFGFGQDMPGLDEFMEGFDPEQFDQFMEGLDPEQLQQHLDELFRQFGVDPEQFDQFMEGFDPEQFDQFFEGLDPEQFQQDLGPLFDSDQFGDLFDQFMEGIDPEQFDQFMEGIDPEQFDQFFEGMPPFGEHQAGRRSMEPPATPDWSGGSWFPSGLDRDQIESCLAELD